MLSIFRRCCSLHTPAQHFHSFSCSCKGVYWQQLLDLVSLVQFLHETSRQIVNLLTLTLVEKLQCVCSVGQSVSGNMQKLLDIAWQNLTNIKFTWQSTSASRDQARSARKARWTAARRCSWSASHAALRLYCAFQTQLDQHLFNKINKELRPWDIGRTWEDKSHQLGRLI